MRQNGYTDRPTAHIDCLDLAFGLARNDTFECHPDRGSVATEWRDL
jgi:hypothetical protein